MKLLSPVLLSLLFLLPSATVSAQTPEDDEIALDTVYVDSVSEYKILSATYRYRVSFRDKDNNSFSLKRPEEFLSQRALDRRARFGIKVDKYDLPIPPVYLEYVERLGFKLCNKSKWNNSAVFETSDTTLLARLAEVKYIKDVRRVAEYIVYDIPDSLKLEAVEDVTMNDSVRLDSFPSFYGLGEPQVTQIHADSLHRAGFDGTGVVMAVIDGGFCNADSIADFSGGKILGTYNFVDPAKSVYRAQDHGTMVLSCIAANRPNVLVGTAPGAKFYLLMSEDGESEQPVEEDNWAAALEMADSLGADVVNSSLGYTGFDDPSDDHSYRELDGRTSVASRAASLAASRGMVVVCSAGNSGIEAWKKIGCPADATDILAVGAVTCSGKNTWFSSVGNTADGRVKPDVMARGEESAVYEAAGTLSSANGTSFSSPTLAGGVACLVQAFPKVRPADIIHAIQQTASRASYPDNIFGYGIANLWEAYKLLKR